MMKECGVFKCYNIETVDSRQIMKALNEMEGKKRRQRGFLTEDF